MPPIFSCPSCNAPIDDVDLFQLEYFDCPACGARIEARTFTSWFKKVGIAVLVIAVLIALFVAVPIWIAKHAQSDMPTVPGAFYQPATGQ